MSPETPTPRATVATVPAQVAQVPSQATAATRFTPAPISVDHRADGERAGYAAGWVAGARAAAEAAAEAERRRAEDARRAQAERDAEVAAGAELLAQAAARLAGRTAADEAHLRGVLQAAAFELAEAVLRRELRSGPGSARDLVERALALPGGIAGTTLHVSPVDVELLTTLTADAGVVLPEGVQLVADARLAPGDVLVEDATGALDGRIRAALDRARAALAEDLS